MKRAMARARESGSPPRFDRVFLLLVEELLQNPLPRRSLWPNVSNDVSVAAVVIDEGVKDATSEVSGHAQGKRSEVVGSSTSAVEDVAPAQGSGEVPSVVVRPD